MNFKFRHILYAAILSTCMLYACEKDSGLAPDCRENLFYVSSAVCSESSSAAALRDDAGEIYIARNLFLHIAREEVTIDMQILANFELTGEPMDRSQCGQLMIGPEILLSCFSLAE